MKSIVHMNQFFTGCKRCLSPKVVVLIVISIIALLIIVPLIGVASLIAAAPLLGCTLMCGLMALTMRGDKNKVK